MAPVYENGVVREVEDEYLYDPAILERLDFAKSGVKFNPPISAAEPGAGLRIRPLSTRDYDRGFIKLLSQLTEVGDVSREQFLKRFHEMKQCPNTYFITVVEDTETANPEDSVIGAATLVVEQKFIHQCAVRGRLEDVVVNDTYRGKQLGKLIVTTITMLAREMNCYKISLDCKDKMIPYYESLGFTLEPGNSNYMTMRILKCSL
ncbi:probable glucosamine 6-phosphate N-acetyltransferase [Ischnura elegans]|uniref:probable glucosamine 6-phosphate N-acetyltransferase n=1 Tax=Ischnura elegans TaxID=197161 RepID=UPI001ED889AA|nr:probable glucosamine 6-phosphate N-acetyltransferase [Ischnura elegans]